MVSVAFDYNGKYFGNSGTRGIEIPRSKRFKDFSRVLVRLHFGPDTFDPAIRANQERDAVRPFVLSAHENFFAPHAVGFHDALVRIGNEREWKFEFPDELVV